MRLRPLHNKMVVERLEAEEKSPGGIIIPDSVKEKPLEGMVISVGPGKVLDDGSNRPMPVKEGDHVLFSKYAGTEIELDGRKLLILTDDDLMGRLSREGG